LTFPSFDDVQLAPVNVRVKEKWREEGIKWSRKMAEILLRRDLINDAFEITRRRS